MPYTRWCRRFPSTLGTQPCMFSYSEPPMCTPADTTMDDNEWGEGVRGSRGDGEGMNACDCHDSLRQCTRLVGADASGSTHGLAGGQHLAVSVSVRRHPSQKLGTKATFCSHGGRAVGEDSVHLDEDVFLVHSIHRVGEGDGHGEGQPLWHCHHHDGDCNNETIQQRCPLPSLNCLGNHTATTKW